MKPSGKSSNKEQSTFVSPDEQESAQKSSALPTEDEDGNTQDDKSDMEKCLSRQKPMDAYFEETLSCMGKPVHSLESLETQVSAFSLIVSDEAIAEQLNLSADQIIRTLDGRLSAIEKTIGEWQIFVNQVQMSLQQMVMRNYHQDIEVDSAILAMNIQQTISDFLRAKQCSTLPESSINQYAVQSVNFEKFYSKQFVMGKQIEGEVEREFAKLIKEKSRAIREITSFCFPDYIWPDNLEERIESGERFQLDILKKAIGNL